MNFTSSECTNRVKITFRATVRSEMDRERERHGNVGSQVERKERPDAPKYSVDREATCPLLLRVFCSTSRHSSMSEYSKGENISNFNSLYVTFYKFPGNFSSD